MTPKLVSKLPDHKPSIFGEMNRVAAEHNAINLAQGFPDFDVDPELIRMHQEALNSGHNQYAPMPGVLALREAIAAKTELLYGTSYDPNDEITITTGASQALYAAISACIHPGDEVIIFKPCFDSYEPIVKLQGGVPVLLGLEGSDFRINWEAFDAALTPKTRMVIINTPHNPTGTILEAEDLEALNSRLRNTDILVLSDEVYEHLVFDNKIHQSVCRYPGLVERSFVCASFGKTFHITGWRTGYCLAPRSLMKEFRKIHEFTVFAVSHAAQIALCNYLKNPEHFLHLPDFIQRKRDLFLDGLKNSRFTFIPSSGTYFQILDYSHISQESDVDFVHRLAREYGVGGIPISVFNINQTDHKQLRFCFAKKDETLIEAANRLSKV